MAIRIPEFVTRPLADVVALVRDLATSPREVLLVRAHRQWVGAVYLAALSLPALAGWKPRPLVAVVVVVLAGTSLALDLLGTAAHIAWHRGRIWQGIDCEVCGDDDGPDEDDDEDDDPDVPGSPYALTEADREWLHSLAVGVDDTPGITASHVSH